MVPADSTVVDHNICTDTQLSASRTRQASHLRYQPQAHRETAFHWCRCEGHDCQHTVYLGNPAKYVRTFFTSNRFFESPLSTALPVDVAGGSTSISVSAIFVFFLSEIVPGDQSARKATTR